MPLRELNILRTGTNKWLPTILGLDAESSDGGSTSVADARASGIVKERG